jgi:hypothetical protein
MDYIKHTGKLLQRLSNKSSDVAACPVVSISIAIVMLLVLHEMSGAWY